MSVIKLNIDSYQEGSWALPQQEFGLDVIALVGAFRYQEHRSIAQIHRQLCQRGVEISERSVAHLLERYDELVALWLTDKSRLKAITEKQRRLILAIDGMQPDVGHEVLWVIRDCLSGEILLAKALLSSKNEDLAALLLEVKNNLDVEIDGVISDGQVYFILFQHKIWHRFVSQLGNNYALIYANINLVGLNNFDSVEILKLTWLFLRTSFSSKFCASRFFSDNNL